MSYEAKLLSDEESQAFSPLLTPDPFALLNGYTPLYRLGITLDKRPIAYLEANTSHEVLSLAIRSISIAPDAEPVQLIPFLSHTIAALVKSEQLLSATAILTDTQLAASWCPYLSESGWAEPALFKLQCRFDAFTFAPPWLHKAIPLPAGTTLFPWSDLTPEEEAQLARWVEQEYIPSYISPLTHCGTVEPINSVGLRSADQILGWMVTHRLTPDTIGYSCFFVHKEYEAQGHAIYLLAEAIKRQTRSSVQWALSECNAFQVDSRLLRFYSRALIPYTTEHQKLYWSWLPSL